VLYCISSEQQLESEMNERIRELADQILPNEKEFHQGDPKEWGYFFTGEELEKFAELIVRECIDTVLDCTVEYSTRPQIADELREHFGVEE
jgi:hypothetical protein